MTAETAAANAPSGRWELVQGEVVTEMPVQPEHGIVVNRIAVAVFTFLGSDRHMVMGPEIGFIVARDPDTVRAPDWSLTWREQAEARCAGTWIVGGPNLAVEVVSPDDAWSNVQDKVDEYLAAGTQLVWVIDPQRRSVHIFRLDVPVAVLRGDVMLTGDPVLPGLQLSLATLFEGIGAQSRETTS